MKMFSDCSGPCLTCVCYGHGCIAGHGDDYWSPAPQEELRARLAEVEKMLAGVPEGDSFPLIFDRLRLNEDIKALKAEIGDE